MHRYELEDRQWELIEDHFKSAPTGRPGREPRVVLNGILWILFSGAPWRDLPERYGAWQTAHRRFSRWQNDGTWSRLLSSLHLKADERGLLDWSQWNADSTSIRAARAAAGARKKRGRNG